MKENITDMVPIALRIREQRAPHWSEYIWWAAIGMGVGLVACMLVLV